MPQKNVFVYASPASIPLRAARELADPIFNDGYDPENPIKLIRYQGLEALAGINPDVALVEIYLEGRATPDHIGNAIIRSLREHSPETKILTWFLEPEYERDLLPIAPEGVTKLPIGCGSKLIIARVNEALGLDPREWLTKKELVIYSSHHGLPEQVGFLINDTEVNGDFANEILVNQYLEPEALKIALATRKPEAALIEIFDEGTGAECNKGAEFIKTLRALSPETKVFAWYKKPEHKHDFFCQGHEGAIEFPVNANLDHVIDTLNQALGINEPGKVLENPAAETLYEAGRRL